MTYDLLGYLSQVRDFRRKEGLRYPLAPTLAMIIMAIICGAKGYREFARFMQSNKEELSAVFSLRHGLPSHVTIREILQNLDLKHLKEAFEKWMQQFPLEGAEKWVAIDGKSLAATVKDAHNPLQSFVIVVSAFAHESGLVYGMRSFDSGKIGEAGQVRQLIEHLGLKEVTFTLDAAHCQKKPY